MYIPKYQEEINRLAGSYNPSMVKAYNNQAFLYWQRSLTQRAMSTLIFELPETWQGEVKDFFLYSLFNIGYLGVFDIEELGTVFNFGGLKGYNFFYNPTQFILANPYINDSREFNIGEDCEIIKLTPDYQGIYDIVCYYAEKLACLDVSINTAIINSKVAYLLGGRNKAAGEAIKKCLDKINKGEPAVVFDQRILNDKTDKESPFQLLERQNIKNSYLLTDLLRDFQTLINQFDAEIGIPTVPYEKKERMVTDEANSRQIDSTSRSQVWFDTLTSSIDKVNKMFNLNISVKKRFDIEEGSDSNVNCENDDIRNGAVSE